MLNKSEFLKLVGTMTQTELDQYWTQLQRWTDKTYPRLCAIADAWTECDIKDYKEGIRLCSALRSAREFCTQPMAADALKRLQRVRYYINEIDKFCKRNKLEPHVISAVTEKKPATGIVAALPTTNEFGDIIPAPKAPRITAEQSLPLPLPEGMGEDGANGANGQNEVQGVSKGSRGSRVQGVQGSQLKLQELDEETSQGKPESTIYWSKEAIQLPFHPTHLSDYISMLSPQLQKESVNLPTWYLELSEYHYILEKLVADQRASQADRRYYARLVTKIENKILSFYHRVNAEWEEKNGKKVSDEVKRELERERRSADISTVNEGGSMTREEIESLTDPELREKFKAQRIKRNIRYLAERVHGKDAAENVRQVLLEMKEWNKLITRQSAAKVKEWYDIDVDPSQIEPEYTEEEKATIRKERRAAINAKYKASQRNKLTAAEKEAQKRIRAEERAAKRAKEKEEEKLRYQEIARAMGEEVGS